jgi:hypothetical protein
MSVIKTLFTKDFWITAWGAYKSKKVPSKDVWYQMLLELWPAFIISLLITIFTVKLTYEPDEGDYTWYCFTYFFKTFFFIGYFFGQYIRVNKQLSVEGGFKETAKKIVDVSAKLDSQADKLEEKTNNLLGHLTGGNSYCKYQIYDCSADFSFYMEPELVGDYPLKFVRAVMMNFANFGETIKAYDIQELHNLNGSSYALQLNLDLKKVNTHTVLMISFYSNNGYWTQNLTLVRLEDYIHVESVITRKDWNELNKDIELEKDTYKVGLPVVS